MTMTEIVNELLTCDEIDCAQIFVWYWKAVNTNGGLALAHEVDVTADDMNNFDLEGFTKHIHDVLDEIIFSEEIEDSAWWKGEQA